MTEAEMQKRLSDWTGQQTADYGALCNDLAQLKLQKGEVLEAQELFQKALAITEQAQSQAEPRDSSEDEWESSWQNNLQQLQQPRQALPIKKQPSRHTSAAQHPPSQPNAAVLANQGSNDDSEEMEVPYDGAHLLECYGMTQYDTTLKLEKFLQQLEWKSVAPVVRPVDDTHAVIVCTNPADAREVLQASKQPSCVWQLQPFDQACAKSKALKAGELQPPRVRQRTTAAVARRMIGNALNVTTLHDKAAEKDLREQRQQKKAAKAEKQKQFDAAWGDD